MVWVVSKLSTRERDDRVGATCRGASATPGAGRGAAVGCATLGRAMRSPDDADGTAGATGTAGVASATGAGSTRSGAMRGAGCDEALGEAGAGTRGGATCDASGDATCPGETATDGLTVRISAAGVTRAATGVVAAVAAEANVGPGAEVKAGAGAGAGVEVEFEAGAGAAEALALGVAGDRTASVGPTCVGMTGVIGARDVGTARAGEAAGAARGAIGFTGVVLVVVGGRVAEVVGFTGELSTSVVGTAGCLTAATAVVNTGMSGAAGGATVCGPSCGSASVTPALAVVDGATSGAGADDAPARARSCARSAASRKASRLACQARMARRSSVSAVAVSAPG